MADHELTEEWTAAYPWSIRLVLDPGSTATMALLPGSETTDLITARPAAGGPWTVLPVHNGSCPNPLRFHAPQIVIDDGPNGLMMRHQSHRRNDAKPNDGSVASSMRSRTEADPLTGGARR